MASPQPNVGVEPPFGSLFWLSLMVGAAAAGFAAGALLLLLHAVQRIAWGEAGAQFLDAVQGDGDARRVAVLVLASAIVVASRLALRLRGSGHGGELAAGIWFRAGEFPVVRTLLNAVTAIVVVGLGAALGREAAPKQTGALLTGLLARWSELPPSHRRLLAACGAGAGVSAIYNVPFGGALFALEVLLGSLSFSLIAPALAASMTATICAWTLIPDQPTYHVPSYPISPQLVGWALIAGPALGVAAALYVRLICWADAMKPRGWRMFAAPALVFAALGLASIRFPQLLGNGKNVDQLAFTGAMPIALALWLIPLRPVATAACLGSGAPGGLFMPTLTVGALIGAAGGQAWMRLWPGGPHEAGVYALIGAGAFLAACTQGPVSAVALILELTRRVDPTMSALMLAVAGAIFVARRLEKRSIYSGRIHAAREPVARGARPGVSVAARMPEVLRDMAARPGGGLAVIGEKGALLGTIGRETLLRHVDELRPSQISTAGDLLELARRDPQAPGAESSAPG